MVSWYGRVVYDGIENIQTSEERTLQSVSTKDDKFIYLTNCGNVIGHIIRFMGIDQKHWSPISEDVVDIRWEVSK